MTKEIKITDMIREMEDAFKERDALYKERDEAFQQRYQTLKQLEETLAEEKNGWDQTRSALQTREEELKNREETLSLREKKLEKDQLDFEVVCSSKKAELEKEEYRLYLLKAQLKNEQVRHQIARIRDESQILEDKAMTGQEVSLEKGRPGAEHTDGHDELLKENQELKGRLASMEQEIAVLEEDKHKLFCKLLEADPLKDLDGEYILNQGQAVHLEEIDPPGDVDRTAPGGPQDDPDEEDFMDELFDYYDRKNDHPAWDMTDGEELFLKVQRARYFVNIVQSSPPFFEIHYPLREGQKLLKEPKGIVEKDGMEIYLDRNINELVIEVPFDPEDAPDDIDNHIRCLVEYEVPAFTGKE